MLYNLLETITLKDKDIESIIQPLLDICSVILPALLTIVGAVGMIWCVLLGVRYARAEDPQEHEKAKNGLKNAIIGFVLIFVLLIALSVAMVIFKNWWQNYEIPQL
ncbi:MAG: pilin [Clostridia bacterium]|nr:pilin [Clostridia bacterium]